MEAWVVRTVAFLPEGWRYRQPFVTPSCSPVSSASLRGAMPDVPTFTLICFGFASLALRMLASARHSDSQPDRLPDLTEFASEKLPLNEPYGASTLQVVFLVHLISNLRSPRIVRMLFSTRECPGSADLTSGSSAFHEQRSSS